MKNWVYFVIAVIFYLLIHEGLHAFMALLFNEYETIKIHWYGPEVLFATPVPERTSEIKWFLISGVSNLTTILIGYMLFINKEKFINHRLSSLRGILYYATIVFLLFDAINLSIGPFFYGGDINGISTGLKLKAWIIQILFGAILIFNRKLIIKLMRQFGIKTSNILFKPWYREL